MFRFLKKFAGHRSGGVAVMFGLGVPALAVLAVGAIELFWVSSDNVKLQGAADAAALAGAQQLRIAEAGVEERVGHMVASNITPAQKAYVSTAVELLDQGRVKVTIEGRRPSFFGNLLPPGGWKMYASATAAAMNMAPLCVLAHGGSVSKTVSLKETARIDARSCLVHSNGDLVAEGSSSVQAAMVHTVKAATGQINPMPSEGAAPVGDPFTDLNLKHGLLCNDLGLDLLWSTKELKAGVHCGIYMVAKGQTLKLAPGEHYFAASNLQVKDDGKLEGRDVVLVLDKASKVKFHDQATVDLEGRKSGHLAGFLLITARENTSDLELWSDNIDNLLGVVYAPNARLVVDGKEEIAEDSDWTVVVAKSIELKGSAKLKLNTEYASSLVPVPEGVGPNLATRLTK